MYVQNPTVIQIYIQTLTGKRTTVEALQGDTIMAVKEKIQAIDGIPTDLQRLIYGGKELENIHNLYQYNVQSQETLHLVLRLAK